MRENSYYLLKEEKYAGIGKENQREWFVFCADTIKNIMGKDLEGKKVAILTENGFEEIELTSPMNALEQAGVHVDVVSPQKNKVRGWDHDHWGIEVEVNRQISEASPEDYDMLMIPGGVMNPDKMRQNPACVLFARHFLEQGKPVAAICHAPQLLIETEMISNRQMTSYPSIKTDLINAGVDWIDKEVVVDNGLVTSRNPDDLPAFNKKMLEELAEGRHATTGQFTRHDRHG